MQKYVKYEELQEYSSLNIVSLQLMTNQEIREIKGLLQDSKPVVIIPHKNPDGDAIGSTLALSHYLKKLNHDVAVIAPNAYPEFLKWMPGESSILIYEGNEANADSLLHEAAIIFTLDFNALNRIGTMQDSVTNAMAVKIMIDHHQQPDNYAQYTYSDSNMSSTCEMVFNFIDFLGDTEMIDEEIASCLYAGIVTDTGSFRYPSTTGRTHRIIADLIEKGAKNSEIHNKIYDTNSYSKLQLLGRALNNLRVIKEYQTAFITLSQEELNSFEFKKGDTEGFVNYGLSIKDVKFAVIFIENHMDNIIKISLRSKGDFSVNEFARKHYDGGGHTNAAGGKSDLSLEETVDNFISILPHYKNALNK